MKRSNHRIMLFAALVGMLVLGCEAREATVVTPSSEITAEDVISRTHRAMREQESLYFRLKDADRSTAILPGFTLIEAYGDVGPGGQLAATLELLASEDRGLFVRVEIRTIDGRTYVTNPVNGRWEFSPQAFMPLNFTNLGRNLARILVTMSDLNSFGITNLEGADVYYMKGVIESDAFDIIVAEAARGRTVEAEVWIDAETWVLRRATLKGSIVRGASESNMLTLELSRYGEQVIIEPPN